MGLLRAEVVGSASCRSVSCKASCIWATTAAGGAIISQVGRCGRLTIFMLQGRVIGPAEICGFHTGPIRVVSKQRSTWLKIKEC
jgi:hypothetical protein